MDVLSRPLIDRTLPLLAEGYAWLPNRMRDTPGPVVRTRILGRPALALRGPEAVRFFYDEQNVHRHRAIPEPVLATLFGHEAVHTLDGVAHRTRKSLFLPLLAPGRIAGLVDHVTGAWDEAVPAWGRRGSVVLFDEAGTVLTTGVHRWAGIPLDDADAEATA
ncbi:cytochrome P450, partial [Streptomyces sp. NPDC005009]